MDTNIASTIRNAARKQATDIMDPGDLEQELWVFYIEQLQDRDYHEGAVVDLIKKQAAKTARQERIDYMQFRGAFIYSPAVVRTILEDSVWVDVEDCPDIEGRIDVSNALNELGSSDRRVLHKRFAVNPADRDHLTDTEKKQIERAIDKISMILNGNGRAEVDMAIAAELNTTPVFA